MDPSTALLALTDLFYGEVCHIFAPVAKAWMFSYLPLWTIFFFLSFVEFGTAESMLP